MNGGMNRPSLTLAIKIVYDRDEILDGEHSDIKGNCFEENADGLLEFVVHYQRGFYVRSLGL
jgi:hypothetical protein